MNPDNTREPRHWLDGVRCPTCRTLNASWLTYKPADDPTVTCTECGDVVTVQTNDNQTTTDREVA